MHIEIFGFSPEVYNCNPCNNAKRLCEQKGWEYEFISVADKVSSTGKPIIRSDVMEEMRKRFNTDNLLGMTMPQVFIDGKSIGGFDQFRQYAQSL